MKEVTKLVICSGCGQKFPSIHPDNYYQICSTGCREIIQDSKDELIDRQHAITTQTIWIQNLLNNYQCVTN